jgi:hypothetical protein
MSVPPAKELPDFCGCNRDFVFRHLFYTESHQPSSGEVRCYTCGRMKKIDYGFHWEVRGYWKHESFGNGTWPIPDDVLAKLEAS